MHSAHTLGSISTYWATTNN